MITTLIVLAVIVGFSALIYFIGETVRKNEIKKEYLKDNFKMSFNKYKKTYYNRI